MQSEKVAQVEVVETDASLKGGSSQDDFEMTRMGRKQELNRTFHFISIVGFVTVLQGTWECVLLTTSYGLWNGGTAGVIWVTIVVWLCMLPLIASVAEMASMAPTAGGQYHWVSEFAPKSVQGSLSYIVGWCSCLGWISAIPSCALQLASLIQQMIVLAWPDIDAEEMWQSTLFGYAFLFITFGMNMFLARHLALAESFVLVAHIIGFVVFIGVMWALSPHADATTVFTSFNNGGAWPTQGISALVGLTTPLWCFVGADSGAHMSEELKDASIQLPRAMIWATIFNGVMGIPMLITFCFCITDLEALLDNENVTPVVQVLYTATQSVPGTIVLCTMLTILAWIGTVNVVATTSRQVWAFSRDKGLPFSSWVHRVNPSWDVPLNALLVCLGVSVVLLAINFGSETALNAILSVSNAAILFTYIISIGCIRLKRLRGEPLLPRRWSLGGWGWLTNDIALSFLIVAFVFSFFPEAPSVGDPDWATNFNWAIVIFLGTLLLAGIVWIAGANRHFVPPVTLVKTMSQVE